MNRKTTLTLDEDTLQKLELLAEKLSPETSYFGGRRNNKSAAIRLAVDLLFKNKFNGQSLEDIMWMKYGKRPQNH